MCEWLKQAVLKTALPQGNGGSNPSLSAIQSASLNLGLINMRSRVSYACAAWIAILFALATSSPARAKSHNKLYTFRHPAMGTEFSVYLYAKDELTAQAAAEDMFDEVDRIEQELSNYQPTSELSRINREAAVVPVTTDPETFRFLERSQYWSVASGGAFDISVGPLMKAWGFFDHKGSIPSTEELERVRPMVGSRVMQLDVAKRSVYFRLAGVELDPGGIGKGFAVDAAVMILHAHSIDTALISAGSSTMYALGRPPGQRGWKVVVPSMTPGHAPYSTVWLRDTSLSSANCNEKHFTVAGHVYCHIMDPRTLHPVEGRLHVSIMDPSATTSDALSNVLFVDRPAESFEFLKRYAPEARALIVSGTAAAPQCSSVRWQSPVSRDECPVLAPHAR
jgi:thiamine biosynthesis lipoprotein